jgi:hypothetical protein
VTESQAGESGSGSYQRVSPVSSARERKVKRRRAPLIILSFFLLVILVFLGSALISRSDRAGDLKKIQGKVAMTEQQLRNVVKAKHLSIYWAGPVAGDKYALMAQKSGEAFVRYLPAGRGLTDIGATFRIIATYVQKDAFATTRAAGAQVGNIGFTNVDGNSVFYVKLRPTNVFVGVLGKDIQLEIFDPTIDQALAIALFHGQIQPIN